MLTTRQGVFRYLQTNLVPIHPAMRTGTSILYDNCEWVQTHGFRRAFCMHMVYQSGDRYAFHVNDGDFGAEWDGTCEPNMGCYGSWNELLQGVTDRYCEQWGISRPEYTD